MLAYLIERELAGYWRDLDITVAEEIDELGAFCGMYIKGEAVATQKLPQPNALCGKLFEAIEITQKLTCCYSATLHSGQVERLVRPFLPVNQAMREAIH